MRSIREFSAEIHIEAALTTIYRDILKENLPWLLLFDWLFPQKYIHIFFQRFSCFILKNLLRILYTLECSSEITSRKSCTHSLKKCCMDSFREYSKIFFFKTFCIDFSKNSSKNFFSFFYRDSFRKFPKHPTRKHSMNFDKETLKQGEPFSYSRHYQKKIFPLWSHHS